MQIWVLYVQLGSLHVCNMQNFCEGNHIKLWKIHRRYIHHADGFKRRTYWIYEENQQIHPIFHFTFELSESEITSPDVTLFKGNRFKSEHILDIKTHIKSTNSRGLSLVYPWWQPWAQLSMLCACWQHIGLQILLATTTVDSSCGRVHRVSSGNRWTCRTSSTDSQIRPCHPQKPTPPLSVCCSIVGLIVAMLHTTSLTQCSAFH